MPEYNVDIIIPTYGPGERFRQLLDRLAAQTLQPGRIIIVNTDDELWSRTGAGIVQNSPLAGRIRLIHISKEQFDHAYARNLGVSLSEADYFVCMTQDAVPADRELISRLIASMGPDAHGQKGASGRIRMSYARQLAGPDDPETEKLSRRFNYPDRPMVKKASDIEALGIKAFFASNVCAAYDRRTFDSLGGFSEPAIFNEDMVYAAGLLKAGYAVSYVSSACVIHSHTTGGGQLLRRNFDNAVSQQMHPEVFEGISSESEGIRFVRTAGGQLIRSGHAGELPAFLWQCGCRYLGFLLGRNYRKLPAALVRKISLSREFWERRGDRN